LLFLYRIGRNINVLNLLLMAAIGVLASSLMSPPGNPGGKIQSVKQSPVLPPKSAEEGTTKHADRNGGPSMSDFTDVAENNLFHSERRMPHEKTEAAKPKPEIVLYGTLVTDDVTLAFIEDKKAPKTTSGRGKRQTTLKKGDTVSGFQLTSVESDRIVLIRGDEIMTIPLMDSEKRKDGGHTMGPGIPVAPGRNSGQSVQTLAPPLERESMGKTGGKNQSATVLPVRGGR
jgi:hypothetical protein